MQLELCWTTAEHVRPSVVAAPAPSAMQLVKPRQVVAPPEGSAELDALMHRYREDSRAKRTIEAYDTDWRSFERWCTAREERAFLASPLTVSRYLAHLAHLGRKTSTIHRARIAIGVVHAERGGPRPDRDESVRTLERGIRRVHGTSERSASPLLAEDLPRILRALGADLRDYRDRALLLLGFAGAYRASELVGLDVKDLEMRGTRILVRLHRSKEDRFGRGSVTEIVAAENAELCPVRALRDWMDRAGRVSGPLFCNLQGKRAGSRLTTRTVSRIVQRATARVGLQGEYSAHSLRSGFATSAFAAGASDRAIQLQGRWRGRGSLDRYIHVASVPARRNVISKLL